MNKKNNLLPFLLLVIVVVVCCLGWKALSLFPIIRSDLNRLTHQTRCDSYLPPADLTAINLVGTWVAGYPDQSDILVLREDNKYRQIIHVDNPKINYQSEWQDWWLERKDNGLIYLHLEGMRLCGLDPEKNCDSSGGYGHDFCQDQSIQMVNEGILLVLGSNEQNDNPFPRLKLWFPLGSENTWVYTLQEP